LTYHVQFTPQALEDLSRLDAAIARRIAEKIQWLAEHFDQIQPETLTGSFASLLKLRVGDWRVLYTSDNVNPTAATCWGSCLTPTCHGD
jgi:mRNA-degrading endonuclease RelE of RelBE toxin-antitoxin system